MKKLFVIPVFFLIMLLIGCQENPITEPVTERSNPLIVKEGVINLGGFLIDPASGSICKLVGKLSYIHEATLPINSTNIVINITTDIDALLCGEAIPIGYPWVIKQTNHHTFVVKNMQTLNTTYKSDDEKSFVMHYKITNRDDMMLQIKYLVNKDDLKVKSVSFVPGQLVAE